MRIKLRVSLFLFCLLQLTFGYAQNLLVGTPDDHSPSFTLQQCIDYGLKHQPQVQQALIGQTIARINNAINLADWWPKVNATGNFTHYFKLPTSLVNTAPTGPPLIVPEQTGVYNTLIPGAGVTQNIFTPQLLYASSTTKLYVEQARQVTDSAKIQLVSALSKSFYTLLLTLEQVNILKEDTLRLGRSYTDAYHQYVGGIVDETDYQQANISLNNSKAQLKQANENIIPQYALLKQLMGYKPEDQFHIVSDTVTMLKSIEIDTTKQLKYEKRIEYKQLQTAKALQQKLTNYYKWYYLPSISGFYNYNYVYENNSFSQLFSTAYPNSYFGFSLNIPVFTGFFRVNNLRKSKLQEKLLDWNETSLKSSIYVQYTTAMANYKGNLYNLKVLKQNVAMARRVYFVVDLQYKQGIVPYLNMITAESNLITSEINYLNALFQLLSSKIDIETAMGDISY
ncbi:MAG: TolC family protein [Candidatus Pedobacter colombiensis]|uniref:TolC family protein n=1 Tax=Candidatus Pedobacter colombiensis TaxID=3121371 RepID=A0AAJ5WBW6_9SPHI|nr:TolC family protein [Pedobacter sp.]WEK21440.1 MAG: TolC family protein [Pedobacter sp.]